MIDFNDHPEVDDEFRRQLDRNERHFHRRIDLISKFKSKKFVSELKELMEEVGVHEATFVKDIGKGEKQESDYPSIKYEWVDQQVNGGYSGDDYAGYLYIELKPNRFLRLWYSM